MAVTMLSQFSENGKYFAQITTDGKLKIWNTFKNSLEQEFTPDYHLTSPCTCLHFLPTDSTTNKGASPKKKKRRNSVFNIDPNIALGTSSGLLLVYSITKSDLEYTIESETSQTIYCLSSNDDRTLYSGEEQNVLVWDLEKRKIRKKWKVCNGKVSAILVIPDSDQILTASKNIQLWDIQNTEVLRTFTGHSSEVIFLYHVLPSGRGDAYFISGAKGDRILNCWSLSVGSNDKNAVASFLMEDIVQSISIQNGIDGSTNLSATVRSGVVHVYQHTLNGKCNKPFKPKTTIQIVADTGQSKDVVTPLRINGAVYTVDGSLCVGYGTEIWITFENIVVNTQKKVQCVVRKDPRYHITSKQEQSSNVITPHSDDAHYITSYVGVGDGASATKRKADGKLEVPMEKRLENLTLNQADGIKVPQGNNLANLLVQGLCSKDKSILWTVLSKRDEDVIRNSVKRLPVNVLVPLIQELNKYIQGKTLSSHIGSLWFKHILQIHAGILSSNPDLPELLKVALTSIDTRLNLVTPLNRLKGRLDLLLPQISGNNSTKETGVDEEALLVFNDQDSEETEDEDIGMEDHTESENEWEEESEADDNVENNVESDLDSEVSELNL